MADDMFAGLEEAMPVAETTEGTKRAKRVQTAEEKQVVEAGVAKLLELGVSENARVILEKLVPVWNSGDKETIALAKEEVIKHFGGSEALKDYIDAEFSEEFMPWNGIAKILPIANNIRSFYARRNSTKKTPTVQVNIGGVLYNCDKAYYNSLAGVSKDEKRELLLAHPGTVQAANIPEIEEL